MQTRAAHAMPADGARAAAPDFVGKVIDKGTGRPISGATVALFYAHPRVGTSPFCPSCYADCQKREKTDEAGRFHIASPDHALLFTVLVARTGYAPQFFNNVDPGKGLAAFDLKAISTSAADPKHILRGRIVDAEGQPVADAILEPNGGRTGRDESFGELPGTEPLVVTAGDGTFAFHVASATDALQFLVDARGFAPRMSGWLPVGAKAPATLRVGVGATIAGRVVDPAEKPISGVEFEAVQSDADSSKSVGPHYIGTNADGGFLLTNVVPGAALTVCVHGGGALAEANLAVSQMSLTTGADETTISLNNIHAVPAASLKGKLVLPEGAVLPPQTRLVLGRDGTWDAQAAVVAPDGAFRFRGIPPGEKMTLTVRVRGCHLAKTTEGINQISPQLGNIRFTATSAGAMPDRIIVLDANPAGK